MKKHKMDTPVNLASQMPNQDGMEGYNRLDQARNAPVPLTSSATAYLTQADRELRQGPPPATSDPPLTVAGKKNVLRNRPTAN